MFSTLCVILFTGCPCPMTKSEGDHPPPRKDPSARTGQEGDPPFPQPMSRRRPLCHPSPPTGGIGMGGHGRYFLEMSMGAVFWKIRMSTSIVRRDV